MKPKSSSTQEQQDRNFMELALKQAEIAVARGQTPFGAVIVDRDGLLVAEGHNTVRSDLDPAAHGEVVAIRNAWRRLGTWQRLAGSTLYSSCEPCLLCSFVITQARFRRVVFASRGSDVPGYKPLLDSDFAKAAIWVNAQPDWAALEVTADFMRERALETIRSFPWEQAHARVVFKPS